MRLQEGKQYLVNRITFVGNTTTRDNVIRREMRLVEGSVFNTEALKYSVRRLNQLGYFEQINEQDQNAQKVEKTPGRDGMVDVTLNLKEQNRNQLTFGAGVSQYEGVFGQLAFQTANFLGRGESLTVSLQAGDRAQNYQLAFTEPFLFDRNITGGFDVYKRALQYIGYYTQKSTGGNLTFGFPVADFSRMFMNYAYEQVRMSDLNEAFLDPTCIFDAEGNFDPNGCSSIDLGDLENSGLSEDVRLSLQRNPFIFDSLLIGAGGRRTVSKVIPTFVHNTVDNPIFPNIGKRITLSIDLAMLGGNTQFYKPTAELIKFWRHTVADVVRHARAVPVHRADPQDDDAADLREAVHGRRIHDSRLRHPVDRSCRSADRARARRQQEPAVQRRVHGVDRVAGAPDLLLRRRPGRRRAAAVRDGPVPHVHGRRGPVLHAGAQRAVPPDLCRQPAAGGRARQQSAAGEELRLPVRGGVDVLGELESVYSVG